MFLLALETTCDETAAAVITDRLEVLGSAVSSQEALHARFGGVVPELASRAHVEGLLPIIDTALKRAAVSLNQIDCVAVANTPGLAGSLLVGLTAAKTLALALGVPLVAVNHVLAHIYACQIAAGRSVFPCVGLVVSGGHTSLFRCDAPLEWELIGSTIDDAVGEAFDKVASLLGLPYPGGPSIERVATAGDPRAFRFPRSRVDDRGGFDFSFSGLKTAVRYAVAGPNQPWPERLEPALVADLAASFQQAAIEVLVDRAVEAMARTGIRRLCVGGGVAANKLLRELLAQASREQEFELHVAPPALCTDNAVMGAMAWERYRAGLFENLDLDVIPGLMRPRKPPAKSS
ncbi:MAG: tRNA (adenosine(37)-N6)-threonylcarbamoyltransferase complex transferase subunit TsaD [Planctomycetes bacterium]|nr:tRNA (adenosine(37)-N6)-threonylcarbamoyltransferase complex transferase subunit TsaD [Planctomycetota bacterium]